MLEDATKGTPMVWSFGDGPGGAQAAAKAARCARGRMCRGVGNPGARGSILLEFLLVCFVLYLLMAAILTFGRMLYTGQVVQQAADLLGREVARTPLPADITFEAALADPDVRDHVYSRDYLVLDISTWNAGGTGLTMLDWVEQNYNLPSVNRALLPVMIVQEVGGLTVLRYPGALREVAALDPSFVGYSGFTVQIPMVVGRDGGTGIETISWADVVQEIENTTTNVDPFRVSMRGTVAVRVNYPFQSSMMTGYQPGAVSPKGSTIGGENQADDGAVAVDGTSPAPLGVAAAPTSTNSLLYDGEYGLGKQYALMKEVRPYRNVVIGQSVFRREVFR
jgi:hypothetical protein